MTRPVAFLVLISVFGCAKKPPAQPVLGPYREAAVGNCPNTMWQPGDERPANIQVQNLSADSVIVFAVRCLGGTRVGDLGPRETGVFAMPHGALSFNGLLYFRTYRGPQRAFGLERAQPVGDPDLRLVIPEQSRPECPEVWVDGKKAESSLARIPRDQIASVQYLPATEASDCSRIVVTLKH